MVAFGHPGSLVREYDHWVVLVQPKQVTQGALIMACKKSAQSFSTISSEAFVNTNGLSEISSRA